jgi:putative FmdB family regulatory protein
LPTYGYRCPKCSLEFDVWQRMTDEPVASCPTCGTVAHRLFFPAGIVFKGSGFYKTDSRKAQPSGDKGSSSTSSDGAPAKSKTSGTDSKAASNSAPATSD